MNANARTARRTIRQRSAATRAARRIDRAGAATLATYATAAGLTARESSSVASSLRSNAKRLGITGAAGIAFRKGQRHDCRRYTVAEIHLIAAAYRPRKPQYAAARNYLLAA